MNSIRNFFIFLFVIMTIPIKGENNVNKTENDITSINTKPTTQFDDNKLLSTLISPTKANEIELELTATEKTITEDNRTNSSDLSSTPNNGEKISVDQNNTKERESDDMPNTTQPTIQDSSATDNDDSCKGSVRLDPQPQQTSLSKLRKCCPVGESGHYTKIGGSEFCEPHNQPFSVDMFDVILYENCVETSDRELFLDLEILNPCNSSYHYGPAYGDKLIVIQNGSLIAGDDSGSTYEIIDNYCLDMDYDTGQLVAVVCLTSFRSRLAPNMAVLYTVFMGLSIPCLVLVAFCHFLVKELRTLHGLCMAMLSSSLAIGFLLHAIAQASENTEKKLGHAVQFFILLYYMWFLIASINICINVWYYLRLYINQSKPLRTIQFSLYFFVAVLLPFILVLITKSDNLSGMPSYFYQGWNHSIKDAQRYFIPPVSAIIIISILVNIGTYLGFRQLDSIGIVRDIVEIISVDTNGKDDNALPKMDREFYYQTKRDAKNIAYLLVVLFFTWLLEVITFYAPGSNYLILLDIMNALQGIFIFAIFIMSGRQRAAITSYWYDRGSHDCTKAENAVEMKPLSQPT